MRVSSKGFIPGIWDNDNSGIFVGLGATGSGPKAADFPATTATTGPGSDLTTASASCCDR